MPREEDNHISQPPRERYVGFTSDERERILQMLEDHERARWFWSTIGIAIKWIVSVGTATAILIATMKWGFEGLAKWRP